MPGRDRRSRAVVRAAYAALLTAVVAGPAATPAGTPLPAAAQVELTTASIHLVTGDIDPASVAGLTVSQASVPGRYIVQFDRPVSRHDRVALEEGGARVTSYLPDRAFVVRVGDGAAIPEVAGIGAIVVFEPAWRISPRVAAGQIVRIVVDDEEDAAAAADHVEAIGLEVLRVGGRIVLAAAPDGVPEAVAALDAVAWVEPFDLPHTHNEAGGGIIGIPDAHAAGYDGSTQIVAVADTGLGDGTTTGAHPDIPESRVVDVLDYPGSDIAFCQDVMPDGAHDVDSGHGTHVAGSVLSDGDAFGVGEGTAPAAQLVFQAVEDYVDWQGVFPCNLDDGYYLVGIPDDLGDLLQDAYDLGARIHSDSWGSDVDGDYTLFSEQADTFMWDNPDMLMVTSAGNAGVDSEPNGEVDSDSTGSPATAKNLLTVGASEGERPDDFPCDDLQSYVNPNTGLSCQTQAAGSGLNDIFTYGSAWPADFPMDPLSTDPSAGDPEQMAAFSSRGPTDDGRIKPDIVAPGTWILSGYSSLYQEGYGVATNPQNGAFQYDGWGFPYSTDYKYMGGTSMSAPIAAGAAAVVRDFYEKAHAHEASAALTKATLINTAVDLLDENNDGDTNNDHPIPNDHEGWGRIEISGIVDDDHVFSDGLSLDTGESNDTVMTAPGGAPLKVTLVWTDYPSTAAAAINLVNDLDLEVTAPDGTTTYLGNVFSGGWSATGGNADDTNNVENVFVETAAAGSWTIEVAGTNVPMGPQPYALVVHGANFSDTQAPTWPEGAALTQTGATETSVTVDWSQSPATDDVGVATYDVFVDGDLDQSVAGTTATITGLDESSSYSVVVQARDAAGNTSTGGPSVVAETLDTTPPAWPAPDVRSREVFETSLELLWSAAADANPITYTVTDTGSAPARVLATDLATTAGTSVTISGLNAATTYQLAVTASDQSGNETAPVPIEVTTAPDFADTNGHIFEDDIAWMAARGITLGCDASNFCPGDDLTRAQMASLIARAFDLPPVAGNRFDDVSGVHLANINAVAEAGITLGCSADGLLFCPHDAVTRGQMASFMARAFGLAPSNADAFSDDDGSTHEQNIDAIAEVGITLGCQPDFYCPLDTITRGQLAAFLHRGFVNLGLD